MNFRNYYNFFHSNHLKLIFQMISEDLRDFRIFDILFWLQKRGEKDNNVQYF